MLQMLKCMMSEHSWSKRLGWMGYNIEECAQTTLWGSPCEDAIWRQVFWRRILCLRNLHTLIKLIQFDFNLHIFLAALATLYLPLLVVVAFLHHWRRTCPARRPGSEDTGENGGIWFHHQKMHISNLPGRWKWSFFNSNSVIFYMELFFHFLRLAGLVEPETQMLFILIKESKEIMVSFYNV